MLLAEHVSRKFGTTAAVSDASFRIERGSFTGVYRPLGRGKIEVAAAHDQPPGRSERRAHPLPRDRHHHAARSGAAAMARPLFAMIFQQFDLVGRLDVLTNVLMGVLLMRRLRARLHVARGGQGDRHVGARAKLDIAHLPRTAAIATADRHSAGRVVFDHAQPPPPVYSAVVLALAGSTASARFFAITPPFRLAPISSSAAGSASPLGFLEFCRTVLGNRVRAAVRRGFGLGAMPGACWRSPFSWARSAKFRRGC